MKRADRLVCSVCFVCLVGPDRPDEPDQPLSLSLGYPLPPCRLLADSPTVRGMIRTFQGVKPTIPASCFIEETGVVIGDVVLGEHCSIWFHAVVRGDVHYIRIGDRTNVQDLCMLHVTHDTHPLIIGNEVTIGHGAILHGCTIKDRVLIGMAPLCWMEPWSERIRWWGPVRWWWKA